MAGDIATLITALLAAITPVWDWVLTTFVPTSASSISIVHFALWSPIIMGLVGWGLGIVRGRGMGRR